MALLSLLPLLTRCAGEPISLEQARSATVVEAAGARLSGTTLERWLLASSKPPSDSAVAILVSAWIDEALLATAMQRGPPLDDSVTVDAAIQTDAARGSIREFWLERYANRTPASDIQVDSLYERDQLRVLQQLQLLLPRGSDSATIRRIGGRAVELRRRALLPGAKFSALVREASEDSVGRAHDGFLPAARRGEMPPAIAGAVWGLQPGGVSAVLRSSAAFHLFRRATQSESRQSLRQWLEPQLAQRADRRFGDSVVRTRQVKLAPDAAARVRAMAREPLTATGQAPLATWNGGELTPIRAREGVVLLSPLERVVLSDASDSATTVFISELVQQEIFLALAVPAGGVTARARTALAPAYRVALDSVRALLIRVGGSAPDPAAAATALVDSVVGLALLFRPLPGGLAGVLRSRYSVAVDSAALGVLLRTARVGWQKLHAAADSTRGDSLIR
jgi:PPIC-type peptidyl-prolyl cis-trans isomerase-like protein